MSSETTMTDDGFYLHVHSSPGIDCLICEHENLLSPMVLDTKIFNETGKSLQPGSMEEQCPGCGQKYIFEVFRMCMTSLHVAFLYESYSTERQKTVEKINEDGIYNVQ